tara:strand:+ start:658 stop:1149 length:492 start_codon:yes stop_codon:yes gene_type:complete
LHESYGSCILITNNDPTTDGVSARVFPQDMSVGWWYLPASKGLDSDGVLKWLSDNAMETMLSEVPGVFSTQEYTQLVIMSKKNSYVDYENHYSIDLFHPQTDRTWTKEFTLPTQWWMTLLSQLYPGCKLHKSMAEYHRWREAKAAAAVDKRRATIEASRRLRP